MRTGINDKNTGQWVNGRVWLVVYTLAIILFVICMPLQAMIDGHQQGSGAVCGMNELPGHVTVYPLSAKKDGITKKKSACKKPRTVVKSTKKSMTRDICVRLKAIKKTLAQCGDRFQNAVWGAGTWSQHYLRRVMTMAGMLLGGCISRDVLIAASESYGKMADMPQNMPGGMGEDNGQEDQKEAAEGEGEESVDIASVERQRQRNKRLLGVVDQVKVGKVKQDVCKALQTRKISVLEKIVRDKCNQRPLRYLLSCCWSQNILENYSSHIADKEAAILLSVVDNPGSQLGDGSLPFVLCPSADWEAVLDKMLKNHKFDIALLVLNKSCYEFDAYQRLLDTASCMGAGSVESVQLLLDNIESRSDGGIDQCREHVNRTLFWISSRLWAPFIPSSTFGDDVPSQLNRFAENRLLRLLLEKNEGRFIANKDGHTLLDIAIMRDKIAFVQLLVMLGERVGCNSKTSIDELVDKKHNYDDYTDYLLKELGKRWRRIGLDPSSALRAIFRINIEDTDKDDIKEVIHGCVLSGAEIESSRFKIDSWLCDKDHVRWMLAEAQRAKFALCCEQLLEKLNKDLVDLVQEYYVQDIESFNRLVQGQGIEKSPPATLVCVSPEEQDARKLRLRLLQEWEALELNNAAKYKLATRTSVYSEADMLMRKWLQEYHNIESEVHKAAYEDFIFMIKQFGKEVSENTLALLEAIDRFPNTGPDGRTEYGKGDTDRLEQALCSGARLDLNVVGWYSDKTPDELLSGRGKEFCKRYCEQPLFFRRCSTVISNSGLPVTLNWVPDDRERQECARLFTVSKQDR